MKAIYVRPEISISVIEPSEMLIGSTLLIDGEISSGAADGRRRDEIDEEEYWIEDETVFGSLW